MAREVRRRRWPCSCAYGAWSEFTSTTTSAWPTMTSWSAACTSVPAGVPVGSRDSGYDGWISLDIVPRRESPVAASARSIAMLQTCRLLLARLDRAALRRAQAELDAVETQRLVQQMLVAG